MFTVVKIIPLLTTIVTQIALKEKNRPIQHTLRGDTSQCQTLHADDRRKLIGTKDGALPFAQQHHRELGAIGPSGSENTDTLIQDSTFFIQTGQRSTIANTLAVALVVLRYLV